MPNCNVPQTTINSKKKNKHKKSFLKKELDIDDIKIIVKNVLMNVDKKQ